MLSIIVCELKRGNIPLFFGLSCDKSDVFENKTSKIQLNLNNSMFFSILIFKETRQFHFRRFHFKLKEFRHS